MAERDLMDWKTAQFMESHLGEEYDALIISIQKFGFFVELTEIFVEGLVSIDRLEADLGQRCLYREHDRAIVTEPHRSARGPRSGPRSHKDASSRWATASASASSASIPCAIGSSLHPSCNILRYTKETP